MQPKLGFSGNWELFANNTVLASSFVDPDGNRRFLPINPVTFPIQIEKSTVACYVETQEAKTTWKTGGWLSAKVVTGLTVGGQSDTLIARRWLQLNKINLVRFPSLSDSYSLQLEVPNWFKSITYSVWQYGGPGVADVEGKLDEIYNQLLLNNN